MTAYWFAPGCCCHWQRNEDNRPECADDDCGCLIHCVCEDCGARMDACECPELGGGA